MSDDPYCHNCDLSYPIDSKKAIDEFIDKRQWRKYGTDDIRAYNTLCRECDKEFRQRKAGLNEEDIDEIQKEEDEIYENEDFVVDDDDELEYIAPKKVQIVNTKRISKPPKRVTLSESSSSSPKKKPSSRKIPKRVVVSETDEDEESKSYEDEESETDEDEESKSDEETESDETNESEEERDAKLEQKMLKKNKILNTKHIRKPPIRLKQDRFPLSDDEESDSGSGETVAQRIRREDMQRNLKRNDFLKKLESKYSSKSPVARDLYNDLY